MASVIRLNERIVLLRELSEAITGTEATDVALKASYEEKLDKLQKEFTKVALDSAIKETEKSVAISVSDSKIKPEDTYFDQYSKAQLNANLLAQLPAFSGNAPGEVATFVTRCKQLQRSTEIKEETLVRIVKGKFGANAFRSLEQFEEGNGQIKTLEELYAFMRTNWSLHLSVFQLLEATYAIEKKPEDSWPKFNSILQSSLAKVKFAHSEFVRNSLNVDKPSTDHVFDLLQSHLLMNRLHGSNEDLYRVITCEQSSLKTPTILSQRAQTLETQGLYRSSSVMFNKSGQNHSGQGRTSANKKFKGKGKASDSQEDKPKQQKPKDSNSKDVRSKNLKSKGNSHGDRRDESKDNRSRFPLSLLSSTHWALSDDEQSKNY